MAESQQLFETAEQQAAGLERDNTALRAEVETSRTQLQAALADIEFAADVSKGKEDAEARLHDEVISLRQQLADGTAAAAGIDAAGEKDARITDLERELAAVQRERVELQVAVQARDEAAAALQEQLVDARAGADAAAALREELAEARAAGDAAEAELRQHLDAQAGEVEALRAAADASAAEAAVLRVAAGAAAVDGDRIAALQREVEAVTARSAEKAARIETVEREIEGNFAAVEEKASRVRVCPPVRATAGGHIRPRQYVSGLAHWSQNRCLFVYGYGPVLGNAGDVWHWRPVIVIISTLKLT